VISTIGRTLGPVRSVIKYGWGPEKFGGTLDLMDRDVKQETEEDWRKTLTPEQFHVLREHGTERAGASPLNAEKRSGTFRCAGCGRELFSSETKFESGTGWPSFWAPLEGAIATTVDRSFGMARTEIHCAQCSGHLGHVFPDGPRPTGLRYCMNGVALKFEPDAKNHS
jgi:peptide-methionine (R)-S-oxide reductase